MTVAASQSPSTTIGASTRRAEIAKGDFFTIQHGRTWAQFKHLQKGYENSNVRLSFYKGTVGILMPSREHEIFKKLIGFLLETFLHRKKVEFVAIGSATQEKEDTASAEPDESYEIENLKLAVEVNFTSGDLSKLERYKALGFNEVWVWEDGVLEVYQLQGDHHEQVSQSSIPALSSLNLDIMVKCILMGETSRLTAEEELIKIHFSK
ncbi:MAG: Uma2 family endonuclease [Cyanobacteria bacterium J06621_11]